MRSFLFTILFFTMLSCSSEEPESNFLNGEWEWTSTSGTIAGITITPETEGYQRTILFDGDQFSSFRNDSLLVQTTYYYEEILNGSSGLIGNISFDDHPQVSSLQFSTEFAVYETEDGFSFFEGCPDCSSHSYTKR